MSLLSDARFRQVNGNRVYVTNDISFKTVILFNTNIVVLDQTWLCDVLSSSKTVHQGPSFEAPGISISY